MTIARKDHRCDLCREIIHKGIDYHRSTIHPWDHPDNESYGELKAHHECLKIYQRVGADWDWTFPTDRAEWAEMVEEAKVKEAKAKEATPCQP
jgi:hypothetical protein